MRPAILDQLSATQKAKLFDELIEFLATPSFGAWPKREIEVRVVAALYERQLRDGSLTVARLAEELTVTRTRGRSLVLEARTRLLSRPEDRAETLTTLLKRWPQRAQVDESDGVCASSSRTRSSATCCGTRPTRSGSRSTRPSRTRSSRCAGATTRRCWPRCCRGPGGGGREGRRCRDRRDLAGEKETLAEFDKAMKKWEKRSPQERAELMRSWGSSTSPSAPSSAR